MNTTQAETQTDTFCPRASIFTAAQEQELVSLKQHFPFRIVWGAVDQNGVFEAHTSYDRRKLMSYVRKGWLVATVG